MLAQHESSSQKTIQIMAQSACKTKSHTKTNHTYIYKYTKIMREGTQLGVAKAARAPPCTLPFLGRRFHSLDVISYSSFTNEYLALS